VPAAPVHWIIQENQSDTTDARAITQALLETGHTPHLVTLVCGTEIPEVPDLPDGVPVVCQGPAFVPRALNYPRFRRGLFFDPLTFCWSAFATGWGQAMLSCDGCVVPLSTARDLVRHCGRAFVRPDADSKTFDGAVYDAATLAAVTTTADDAMSVVVAAPVDVEAEWRFFIVDRDVVGCSEYRRWGRPATQGSVPRVAIDVATEAASHWGPAAIYCLDLAATADRIGIVEANCFTASRFYAAPVDRIVEAVNHHVLSYASGVRI
jgi:hypothetical protein